MILEGIVTTLAPDGSVNVSPMGPRVERDLEVLVLRPYRTSRTYRNLARHGDGVFHITDDAELIARAAVGHVSPPLERARSIDGCYLPGACRFYEFRVQEIDDREERTTITAEVVHSERLRDFIGFHRGRHAVVEAAILATRTALIPLEEILQSFDDLDVIVEKTGGEAERRAMEHLRRHIEREIERRKREIS